eukprot:4521246-Pleurochrysis_carterae.AAC.1
MHLRTHAYMRSCAHRAASQDSIVLDNYPDENIPMCTNLAVCLVSAINEGLRGSDIGTIMDPLTAPPGVPGAVFPRARLPLPDHRLPWRLRLASPAAIVTALSLHLTGVNISVFSPFPLRSGQQATARLHAFVWIPAPSQQPARALIFAHRIALHASTKGPHHVRCYCRGRTASIGFNAHTPLAASHLYNGWEQYVAAKIEAEDMSFIPRNTAIVLREMQDREEAENRNVSNRVVTMAEDLRRLSATVVQNSKRAEQLLQGVVEALESQTSALETTGVLEIDDGRSSVASYRV